MSDKQPPVTSGFVQVLDGPQPPRLQWEDEMSDKALIERLRNVNMIRRDSTPLQVAVALCHEAADAIARLTAERDAARQTVAGLAAEADLLAWVLAHPETAAECLEDAAAGDGTARGNLEFRRDALEGRTGAAMREGEGK